MYWSTSFFFNDTATTEIYTLSLHDALPISASPGWSRGTRGSRPWRRGSGCRGPASRTACRPARSAGDRKSTRLNSSHANISYAVFCLKKKNDQVKESGDLKITRLYSWHDSI